MKRGVTRGLLVGLLAVGAVAGATDLAGPVVAQTSTPAASAQAAPAPPAAPAAAQAPKPQPAAADLELIKALKAGGHAIVMRHMAADPDKADVSPLNFKNIRTQQPLTDAGQASARQFGDHLRAIGVPVGEVLTSRFNRAFQTAVLAGFRDARPVTELTEGSLVTSPNEQRRRASALKQLAAAPLAPGTNRLLVTHRVSITQAFGKEWYEVREGEASIFRIDNGAYALVTRLQLTDWERLAKIATP